MTKGQQFKLFFSSYFSYLKNQQGQSPLSHGTRNGIDIRVIQERNGDIVTGFPTNVPRNPI